MKKENHILSILIPSKGICDPAFAVALRIMRIPSFFSQFQVLYVSGADVAVARNELMEEVKGDYLLWLDDDTIPPPNTIEKLLSHNKDIISGLYFMKKPSHFPLIFKVNKENKERYDSIIDYPKNDLIEVDAMGAGCMLIKRKVFEKIKKPYFQYIPRDARGEGTDRKGEDYYFCEKVRKAGFKIYCDTSVICKHIGTMFVDDTYWDVFKKKLDDIKEQLGEEGFEKYKKQVMAMRDRAGTRMI